jgi:hypothetical protein
MTNKLFAKIVCSWIFGILPLIFATMFFASSVQIYRGLNAELQTEYRFESIFRNLPKTSRAAGNIDAIIRAQERQSRLLGAQRRIAETPKAQSRESLLPESFKLPHASRDARDISALLRKFNRSEEKVRGFDRPVLIADSFEAAVSSLAELTQVLYTNETEVSFEWSGFGGQFSISLNAKDPYENYFYNRLVLEKQRQKHLVNDSNYFLARAQLANTYLAQSRATEATGEQRVSESDLQKAQTQINQLQTQVASLKEQLGQTERSRAERWVPIIVAALSLLIAISANLIAWRGERRQSRESELFALKQQELEHSILHKSQQIQQGNCRIITPSQSEINIYSSHNSSNITSST